MRPAAEQLCCSHGQKAQQCNFIAFGGRINYGEDPVEMLDAFIEASFEGGPISEEWIR